MGEDQYETSAPEEERISTGEQDEDTSEGHDFQDAPEANTDKTEATEAAAAVGDAGGEHGTYRRTTTRRVRRTNDHEDVDETIVDEWPATNTAPHPRPVG